MNLAPGTKLGPYEIVSPLGAGGMGEVYRARDTRLSRDVAVKVLPQHLSSQAEVRARFEREARTVSSLNHPHICTLFDVGREGDTDYLVMELIEGETLAQRLARGAIQLPEMLRLGSQIADALDQAHRAGVVHRDLKPGNIMLTRSGAKLMDFGLARATGMSGSGSSDATLGALTQSPTAAAPLTAEGTIIGTFQYMSPEQLEGSEADARSDIWALGCVLYEMVTGKRAFDGRSQASLIGSIMNASPRPVAQITPMVPPEMDRLVSACLARDPMDRVQSAHDVKLQLSWISDASTSGASTVPPIAPAGRRGRGVSWPMFAAIAVVAVTAISLGVIFMERNAGSISSAAEAVPERFTIGLADLEAQSAPAIAPSGDYIIFSARTAEQRQLYRRDLSSMGMTLISGTQDGQAPFFSADGAWIGFTTADAIKKMPSGGGAPQVVLTYPRVSGADWSADGWIYFVPRAGGRDGLTALARVRETGGAEEIVALLDTTLAEGEAWLPEILPDGKTVLITIGGGGTQWHIAAVRPDGKRVTVVENALCSRYVAPGYLLYLDFDSNAVLAAPFDMEALRFTRAAVPLTEPVDANHAFDVVNSSKLVYVPSAAGSGERRIVWISRDGESSELTDARATWTQPRLSPDGSRLLVRKAASNCELWLIDIASGSQARIIHGGDNHNPVWSPDGRRIAYSRGTAPGDMVVHTLEGPRDVTALSRAEGRGEPRSWSEGGNLLVYTATGRGTRSDIWVRAMDTTRPAAPFLATGFNETDPSISRDGKWIAYVSNESGTAEVFVRPYPDNGSAWQISIGGGGSPLWSRDGNELYYTAGTTMMAVKVRTTESFRTERPVKLFDGGFSTARALEFDISDDGRFASVASESGTAGQKEMRILLNWQAVLAQVGSVGR